ncbi:MAG: peptide ABC transporter substrate-binding protein [Methanothrix sp.]|nr:peptide ABC transporter substrate-binding protein [Methanothrix sp.]
MKRLLSVLCLVALALPGFSQVTLRVNNMSEPQSVDPHLISGTPEHRIYSSLFEGLVIADEKGNPMPGSAESWSMANDGLTWTFKMRKGNVWSDGVAITAQTVVKSWLRNLNPATASKYASIMKDIIKGAKDYNEGKSGPEGVAIKAVDDLTFQFVTTGPAPYVLSMLIHYGFAIVPVHTIDKYGAQWILPENWVSNGPFVLKERKPNERIVVVKNPRYWDAKNVKLDQIIYYPSDNLATNYAMYKNGEVDWNAGSPPPDKVDEAKKRTDYIRVPQLGSYWYAFNMQKPPFNDVRVRKAFSLAFDREEVVEKVTKSGEFPASALTVPMAGYTPPAGIGEDVAKAKSLLAEAGYPGGKGFPTVTLLYNTSARHKAIAEYAQQRWEQTLGVKVELVNQEFATYLETRKDGRMGGFNLARVAWVADYQDPNNFLFLYLSNNLDFNDTRWVSTRYDDLVKKANTMAAGPDRMKVFYDAEKILIEDEHVIMPIYWYTSQNLIDLSKWGGWSPNALDQHPLKYVYKK